MLVSGSPRLLAQARKPRYAYGFQVGRRRKTSDRSIKAGGGVEALHPASQTPSRSPNLGSCLSTTWKEVAALRSEGDNPITGQYRDCRTLSSRILLHKALKSLNPRRVSFSFSERVPSRCKHPAVPTTCIVGFVVAILATHQIAVAFELPSILGQQDICHRAAF
jgi:hypothetical protein